MSLAPVTVVVPTFNCGHLLTQAVNSMVAQAVLPEAIIVIDDGSTDDTAARLAVYGNRVKYIHQPNQGVSAARNAGIAAARSEFVAFLDADDVWHPRKLEMQLRVLKSLPRLGLLGTRTYLWPGPEPALSYGLGSPHVQLIPWEQLAVQNVLVTSSVVIRRSVLSRIGGFDQSLQGPEDHDMWIRAAEIADVANLPLPLTGYRETPASLSKHARRMEDGMLRILAKIGERGGWRGRRLLRCEAYSVVAHRCAFMYAASGDHRAAIHRCLRSLVSYPWPYRWGRCASACERPKRLIRSVLQTLSRRPTPSI